MFKTGKRTRRLASHAAMGRASVGGASANRLRPHYPASTASLRTAVRRQPRRTSATFHESVEAWAVAALGSAVAFVLWIVLS